MDEQKDFTPQESLALINSMISKARQRYSDKSFYYLLWGWIVIIACLLHYAFDSYQLIEEPSMAWLVMFIGAAISIFYGMRESKQAKVTHYTDKLYGWLWLSMSIGMIIVIINGQFINFQIVPLILLLAGAGTFVSGAMMKFRALQLGAVCLWAMAIFAFRLNEVEQLLAMAVGIALGYLLPGYIMKFNMKKQRGL